MPRKMEIVAEDNCKVCPFFKIIYQNGQPVCEGFRVKDRKTDPRKFGYYEASVRDTFIEPPTWCPMDTITL